MVCPSALDVGIAQTTVKLLVIDMNEQTHDETIDLCETVNLDSAGAAASRLTVTTFGLTDTGKVRTRNEDQFLIARLLKGLEIQQSSLPEPMLRLGQDHGYLFVVADGMGGHAGGDAASALAVSVIENFVLETLKWFLQFKGSDGDELLDEFRSAFIEAHAKILATAMDHRELTGMATTLTLALSLNDTLTIAHAGDSRCYLWRNESLDQITQDHTLVGELTRIGQISPESAAKHHLRHLVTNAVGSQASDPKVEIHRVRLEAGDTILLCTDGLTEMVPRDQIADILNSNNEVEAAARQLIDRANSAGGRDNITVLLAYYDAAMKNLQDRA
jgi:serine/threonine protein phosphatase PrpC